MKVNFYISQNKDVGKNSLIIRYVEDFFSSEPGDPGIIQDISQKTVQLHENKYKLEITRSLKGEGLNFSK
jgi:hypothetical protein